MTVKYEILVILLHYWKVKKSTAEAYLLICEIGGPNVLNKRTARRYFQIFENGQTDLRRQEGSGRLTVIDNSTLKEVIGCYPNKSMRELSYDLECNIMPHYTSILEVQFFHCLGLGGKSIIPSHVFYCFHRYQLS